MEDSAEDDVERKWPKNKNILKKLKNTEQYILTDAFIRNPDKSLHVQGQIFERFARSNETGMIMLKKKEQRTVSFENLEGSFDFLFEHNNQFYLEEWPLY